MLAKLSGQRPLADWEMGQQSKESQLKIRVIEEHRSGKQIMWPYDCCRNI